jgi:hypothetical protein
VSVRRQLGIEAVPDDIQQALTKDVSRTRRSIQDTVVGILCQRYDVPHTRSKRPLQSQEAGDRLNLKIPEELWLKIRVHAAQTGATARGVILYAVAQHYKLNPVLPTRRKRKGAST